jgi:hypothetical protein
MSKTTAAMVRIAVTNPATKRISVSGNWPK